jgi:hypothetical protein
MSSRLSLWLTLQKETFLLRFFGMTKIPLLYSCLPRVTEFSEQACAIEIALNRRTKNHLSSMYFGALCIGADCAGGLLAYQLIRRSRRKVSLVFKDFDARFLKRPTGDVEFRCTQGAEIREFVDRVLAGNERLEMPVRVTARVPRGPAPEEPVAEFTLTLSLKPQNSQALS